MFLSDFPDNRSEILNLFLIYGIMQCSGLQKCSFEHNNGLKMTLTASADISQDIISTVKQMFLFIKK